jgi:hypothetical protein
MKEISLIVTSMILFSCSSSDTAGKRVEQQTNIIDTTRINQKQENEKQVNPLYVFIDSMKKENYLIDTNRLKKVYSWSEASRSPKEVIDGIVAINLPFVLESEREHFSDPRTYFFAKWNSKDSTFKNGGDYLLMTWKIDSAAIKTEEEIYNAITGFMGNFPAYCFRSEGRIYVIANRMTVNCKATGELAKRLSNYFERKTKIFGPDYHNCQ